MAPYQTLCAFIAHLRTAEITTALPEDEEWAHLIQRIGVDGHIHEVSEETWSYFLEVLPPKYMNSGFAFAEGAEAFKYLWRKEGRYFCRQLTWDETVEFCRLARIPLPW